MTDYKKWATERILPHQASITYMLVEALAAVHTGHPDAPDLTARSLRAITTGDLPPQAVPCPFPDPPAGATHFLLHSHDEGSRGVSRHSVSYFRREGISRWERYDGDDVWLVREPVRTPTPFYCPPEDVWQPMPTAPENELVECSTTGCIVRLILTSVGPAAPLRWYFDDGNQYVGSDLTGWRPLP